MEKLNDIELYVLIKLFVEKNKKHNTLFEHCTFEDFCFPKQRSHNTWDTARADVLENFVQFVSWDEDLWKGEFSLIEDCSDSSETGDYFISFKIQDQAYKLCYKYVSYKGILDHTIECFKVTAVPKTVITYL